MTKCKQGSRSNKQPSLVRLRRQAVEFNFDGGTLTSDSGLLLLREVDRRINLIPRVSQLIHDPRDARRTLHLQTEMLTSRIFGIAAGYEDVNDHDQIRHDAAFQVAAGRTPDEHSGKRPLASPPTISRLENRVDAKTCLRINELLVDIFLESYDSPPEEIVLDYDATDDLVHGKQENRHFNGFYDGYCFLPLYVFCGDQILVAYLRPSSRGAAHHCRAITKLLVQKIRARWPQTRIVLRGDSAYAVERLMRWCDKNDVGYVFGYQKNNVLQDKIAGEMLQAQQLHEASKQTETCFKWFRYRADSWDRHRWMIGKAEYSDQGSNPRFVVTNLPSSQGIVDATYHRPRIGSRQLRMVKTPGTECSVARNPEEFYKTMYCMRGEMENRIKEQQLYLWADRTSCHKFVANQFRLLISSLAYVLLDALRRLGLSHTEQARWRVDTIRLRLIKIAARVSVSCRRVVFHLASHCPSASIFSSALERLCLSG